MASVTSLGLHQPSALPYLLSESILPSTITEDGYRWFTPYEGNGRDTEDELLVTDYCVVWSQAGVTRRVFNYDIEGEKVSHAVLTNFPTSQAVKTTTSDTSLRPSRSSPAVWPPRRHLSSKPRPQVPPPDGDPPQTTHANSPLHQAGARDAVPPAVEQGLLRRALVILLRTQAHVYFLPGTSHVVHLPFEVDHVHPAPCGLILQRKLSTVPDAFPASFEPRAPPNSFVSSNSLSRSLLSPQGNFFRPSFGPSPQFPPLPTKLLGDLYSSSNRDAGKDLPRHFSLTDPLVEMGLVVKDELPKKSPIQVHQGIRAPPSTLDPTEELLYFSSRDELADMPYANLQVDPVILALTVNAQTNIYTVWSASYLPLKSAHRTAKSRTPRSAGTISRRRSSFATFPGTGTTTPGAKGTAGVRESFGPSTRGPSIGGAAALPFAHEEGAGDATIQSPSFLEPEFESDGMPAQQSRRVSSLLARADLSTNQDKMAFSDLASGQTSAQAGNHAPGRRSDSASHLARGKPGAHGAAGNRASMLAPSDRVAAMPSLQGLPFDDLLAELNASDDSDDNESPFDVHEGLKREVAMKKIESFMLGSDFSFGGLKTHRPGVFTILPPQHAGDDINANSVTMCIHDAQSRLLTTLTFRLEAPVARKTGHKIETLRYKGRAQPSSHPDPIRVVSTYKTSSVIDARKLIDGDMSRIVMLSQTKDGRGEISIQAPWSPSYSVELPASLGLFNPHTLAHASTVPRSREGSLKRIISIGDRAFLKLEHESPGGKVDVIDDEGKRHRLQIRMTAVDAHVWKILEICRFVLPGIYRAGEGVLVGFWHVRRWLKGRNDNSTVHNDDDDDWTALIIVLMCMAVPFLDGHRSQHPAKPTRKTAGSVRSAGSRASADTGNWGEMLRRESINGAPTSDWLGSPSWSWTVEEGHFDAIKTSRGASSRPQASKMRSPKTSLVEHPSEAEEGKNQYLLDCVNLTKEFLAGPAGSLAAGSNGFLPTAKGKSYDIRQTALATILVGLHLYREELKLNVATADPQDLGMGRLTALLAQLGGWLDWEAWGWREPGYYNLEDVTMDRWCFDEGLITGLSVPPQPQEFDPPSIYSWMEKCSRQVEHSMFMTLSDIVSGGLPANMSSQASHADRQTTDGWVALTPRTALLIKIFSGLASRQVSATDIVGSMMDNDLDAQMLDTFPEGIMVPLQEAILSVQENPPTTWGQGLMNLVGRDDMSMLLSDHLEAREYPKSQLAPTHEATRDMHSICHSTTETETVGPFDGSAELDRQAITRLVFGDDRRFAEASKLVQSSKAPVVRCVPEPDWSESDLLEAQKEVGQIVAIRTLAVPAGRGLMYFSARLPLLTERFPTAGFNLSCIVKPSGSTIMADKSAFTEEKVGWAFFHNGVAAGLSISRDAKGIDTSWIVFNKPAELSNRHAGLLLALGLNGHLKPIAKWVAFKYLTPKHTMTSIGLLLGLSASFLGTMDSLVTRLLSVHVTRMLPPGAAELNLSPLTQTTGIMGIGLLYCNTQHRRMSEVMLSEMEFIDDEDTSTPVDALRDEGYRLAAGFALGFINLGRGRDMKGLHDMHLVERVLSLATGSKKVSVVHVLDKATAAATMAIALIFMKSNDEAMARKIDVPDTLVQFIYVRPDLLLLRTVAKHLILWDKMVPSRRWIRENLPEEFRHQMDLEDIAALNSEDLALFNILAGLCFSIGLRYAGSALVEVRDLLCFYLDHFIRLCRLQALNYDQRLTRNTVRNCQDVVALSAASVMAGTGDLVIFRRLRSLHGRTDAETPYGSHLAAHMAIGVLFLGGGNFSLGTSKLATASLLCAFYPLFPNSILDNKSHLQAFRHFWVLAAEARCLVARDVDTHRPVSIPVTISLRSGRHEKRTAPCLLPELDSVATVATASPEHWTVVLDFARNPSHVAAFRKHQTIFVRRRVAHDSVSSAFQATLQALNETETLQHRLDWLLDLPALSHFTEAERALVLPAAGLPSSSSSSSSSAISVGGGGAITGGGGGSCAVHALADSTLVDARLVLEKACLDSGRADRLWNLRLLFAWAERAEKEGGRLKWVTTEVVEKLRAAVWLAHGDD